MKILPLLALCLLAVCAAKQRVGALYEPGISTEADMVAVRGQPQSRSVAADRTPADIYAIEGATITQITRPDGRVVSLSDIATGDKKDQLVVKNLCVESPDGTIRKILLDVPDGPNGEIIRHIDDITDMTVKQ